MNESEQELRQKLLREKCRNDDLERGWSNCSRTCAQLQDERDEATARIRALEERLTAPPVQRGTTHWEDCWKDRGHHACAVAIIERLQSDLAAAERSLDRHRADAERYRWLRTHVAWSELYEEVFDGPDSEGRMELLVADELDAAIDAALSPTVSEGAGDST